MDSFQYLVSNELAKVRQKVKPFNSFHEAYGKLCEEVAEFFEEVRAKSKKDRDNTLLELVQIAGVCQRAAENLLTEELALKAARLNTPQIAEWDGNNNTF